MKPDDIIKEHYRKMREKGHATLKERDPDFWKRIGKMGGKNKLGYRKPKEVHPPSND